MNHYSIQCLKVGEIALHKSDLTYNVDYDKRLLAPIFVCLIRDMISKELILVDAGFKPRRASRSNDTMAKGGINRLKSALKAASVNPQDITSLILTHLHNDHASFVGLFKNARIYVQAAELSFARNPLPTQKLFFNHRVIEYVERSDTKLLNGDTKIFDGVIATLTPGHTPGSQVITVIIANKRYTICGDMVPMYHNWFPHLKKYGTPTNLPRIPPGIHTDLNAVFSSYKKIGAISDVLIPSHDPKLKDRTIFS